MIQLFDYFNQYETPTMILCNPNNQELFSLGGIYDRKLKLRFNTLSTLEFIAPYKINEDIMPYYDYLTYRRLVLIPDLGYFMITNVTENNDGILREKKITAQSIEVELSLKKISLFKGYYKFYDFFNPTGTLLGSIMSYLPTWTIGDVDTTIATLTRKFDISDSTIYKFLMNDVEQAYQCIFTFDITNRRVNVHGMGTGASNPVTSETDIYLSYDNLVNEIEIKEITEELVTALNVYGKGNLSINQVNPLGTDTIYNFTYYKKDEWMGQGLQDAITNWENLVESYQTPYADYLTSLLTKNSELISANSDLSDLNSEYLSLEGIQKVRIEANLPYTDVSGSMVIVQAQINAQNNLISSIQTSINEVSTSLLQINNLVKFENNFTQSQLTELSNFIVGNTYNNENFLQTDIMTPVEIQEQAQLLYNQAMDILDKVSKPRYEFSVGSTNFIFLKDFQPFVRQLEMGVTIHLNINDESTLDVVLLGFDLDYDKPDDFSMIFANRFRLDDSSFQFSDLYSQIEQKSLDTSFNSQQWSSWQDNYVDPVSAFISSSLNASNNNIISSVNEEIKINQNGLRGKTFIPATQSYSPCQVWLTSNTLAFTKNNWQTASLALGKMSNGAYGLAGDVIVGRIIAGNELTIANNSTNETSTFVVSGNTVRLTNADMTIIRGLSKIILNPTDGIKIQQNVGGTWQDKFYADASGNLYFTGNLTGATGTFSGAVIASSGSIGGWSISGSQITSTKDSNIFLKGSWIQTAETILKIGADVYFNADGSAKIGQLSVDANGNATFNGTVKADKIDGKVDASNIINAKSIGGGLISDGGIGSTQLGPGSVTGAKISDSTITGGKISGTTAINVSQVTASIFSAGAGKNGYTGLIGPIGASSKYIQVNGGIITSFG